MIFKGKITKVFDVQMFESGSGKREVIIEELHPHNPEYPQSVKVQQFKKADNINWITSDWNYNEGDIVEAELQFKTNEHEGKYYTNIDAWKITKVSSAPQEETPAEKAGDLPF